MGIYDSVFLAYVCITIVLFQLSRFVLVGLYNHFFATRLGIKFVDFKYLGKWAGKSFFFSYNFL